MDNSTYSGQPAEDSPDAGRVRRHAGAEQLVEDSKRVSRAGRRARLRLHPGGKDGATPEQMAASQRREKDLERVQARRAARQEVVAAEKLETGIPAQILRDHGIGVTGDAEEKAGGGGHGFFRPGFASTDQEHAVAVLHHFSDRVRFAPDAECWLIRDEATGVWEKRTSSRFAAGLVARVAQRMPRGNKGGSGQEKVDNSRWQRYQNRTSANAIAGKIADLVVFPDEADAGGLSQMVVRMGELDAEKSVVWTPAGGIDLAGGVIDPTAVHLKRTRFVPAEVETPCWNRLVAEIWPDAEIRAWALLNLSVGMLGASPKMIIHFFGDPDRGKTSIPYLLCDALGDYGKSDLRASILTADANPWDLAELHGVRLAFIDEMPSNAARPTEAMKWLSGGSDITAAYKNKPPFRFTPTHTLVFASNPAPNFADPAVAARVRAIRCGGNREVIMAARAALGDVDGEVWGREGPGVLWQMLELAGRYLRDRSILHVDRTPEALKKASAELVADHDYLDEWLRSATVTLGRSTSKLGWTVGADIYEGFATWCAGQWRTRRYLNESRGEAWLRDELRERNYAEGRTNKRRGLWNIDVKGPGMNGKRAISK